MSNDPLDTFLGVLGSIQEAAWRGYGSPNLAVDLYLEKSRHPDEESMFNVRLIAMDTPRETRLNFQQVFDGHLLKRMRATENGVAALTTFVERMGRNMAEAKATGRIPGAA